MLTVRDIMSTSVVTVSPDTTVRQLARLLADEEVSGVPVGRERHPGRCRVDHRPEDSPFAGEQFLDQFPESELDVALACEIMTPVAFAVGPHQSVRELAEFLVRGRMHRAVADGRLT